MVGKPPRPAVRRLCRSEPARIHRTARANRKVSICGSVEKSPRATACGGNGRTIRRSTPQRSAGMNRVVMETEHLADFIEKLCIVDFVSRPAYQVSVRVL